MFDIAINIIYYALLLLFNIKSQYLTLDSSDEEDDEEDDVNCTDVSCDMSGMAMYMKTAPSTMAMMRGVLLAWSASQGTQTSSSRARLRATMATGYA